ncbi:hypothetical protein FHS43_003223 [Streptosporangium becharense]|uniref:Uncharacterized protein n=1 Tax=Streptosporangium becharense TaxID=1816182 RepID=A0A7W9ID38_9ACTN|nr:hypothetical protein [Streptosporangium becharense]MBB2911943.1 hypothetical protein [Streptosporangium becharense]MBB5818490.1 hypothetical protein [Streptosporangium becharense]
MRTETDRPPHPAAPGAEPLARLVERLAAMAVPRPAHPAAHRIGAAVSGWSRRAGLGARPGDPALHRLAARAFADGEPDAAETFARWLVWTSRVRERPAAIPAVIAAAEGGEPGRTPLERAFAGLWETCAAGMDDPWRARFLAGLAAQREAPAAAGPAAATGRPARAGGDAFGRYLLDLAEPCAGVRVPEPVRASRQWRAVVEASADVAAWCVDLVSGGDRAPVAGVFLERSRDALPERLVDRVGDRMEELWTAARAVPLLLDGHGLGFGASREVMRVACAFLTIPRAYLEWLLESSRYRHLE